MELSRSPRSSLRSVAPERCDRRRRFEAEAAPHERIEQACRIRSLLLDRFDMKPGPTAVQYSQFVGIGRRALRSYRSAAGNGGNSSASVSPNICSAPESGACSRAAGLAAFARIAEERVEHLLDVPQVPLDFARHLQAAFVLGAARGRRAGLLPPPAAAHHAARSRAATHGSDLFRDSSDNREVRDHPRSAAGRSRIPSPGPRERCLFSSIRSRLRTRRPVR